MTEFELLLVFDGSDGDATKQLYKRLEEFGTAGVICVNLFRAQKNSARAKVYRGGIRGQGSFKGMAYDRKQWALSQLTTALAATELLWGWKVDPAADASGDPNRWVLYVELPTGQVSFHSPTRGVGPDFAGEWDGRMGAATGRILKYIANVAKEQCV